MNGAELNPGDNSLGTRSPASLSWLRDCQRPVSLGARRPFCIGTQPAAAPGRREFIKSITPTRLAHPPNLI